MRLLFLILISLLAFAGCGEDDKGGSSPGVHIPADVSLNEKSLPAISDEQFAQSKVFTQNLSSVTGLEDHIFPVGEDESWQDRQNRERRFARLTSEQQVLARHLKDNCQFDQTSATQGVENGLQVGTVVTSQSKIINRQTDLCAVEMLKEMNSRFQILTLNQEAQSGSFTMAGGFHMKTRYTKPEHLAATRMSVADLNLSFSGGSRVEAGVSSSHARMNGQGFVEFTDSSLGRMDIKISGESLVKESLTRAVAILEFRNANQFHVFAFQSVTENRQQKIEKAFIGNRQLTEEEIRELKFDDFAGSLGSRPPRQ
jgi:hypothetical protein